MAARRAKARPASPPPCVSVRVNGKHVAMMGMPGEGGVSINIGSWSRGLAMFLGGTDRNDPKWDRFYEWPAPRLRPGDEIQIRLEDGVPDEPKFRFKNLSFGEDQMPSQENPTYVVVRNVSVWADKWGVLLRANDKGNVPRLTPNSARKVAKALILAADELERSRRKARC